MQKQSIFLLLPCCTQQVAKGQADGRRVLEAKHMPKQLTDQVINAAIEGFKVQKTRLNERIAELRAMLSSTATPGPAVTKRRKFSAAARQHMREAQRQRWTRVRGRAVARAQKAKPKRHISEQGLKNIIAATKRRWALKRLEAAKARKAAVSRKKAASKKVPRKKAA
jgi:hypothetical protein